MLSLKSFTPGIFILSCLSFVSGMAGKPEVIPASPDAGFNFPYVFTVPPDIEVDASTVIVVETNNTGTRDDFTETLAETVKDASGRGLGPMLSRHMSLPLVMPVFPRTKTDWQIYTHALDRDTMKIEEGPLARLDRQLLAMVDDARKRLQDHGIQAEERFLMIGFSASGSFANRFAFLHPGKLRAVVAGAVNAFPMLPVPEREGRSLPFPLGTHDIESLTGSAFDEASWKALPQMIFMGALDGNDAVLYDDAYSDKERETIFTVVGKSMRDRWLASQKVYFDAGANANLITYGQVGHWTNRQIGLSIANFVESVLAE